MIKTMNLIVTVCAASVAIIVCFAFAWFAYEGVIKGDWSMVFGGLFLFFVFLGACASSAKVFIKG